MGDRRILLAAPVFGGARLAAFSSLLYSGSKRAVDIILSAGIVAICLPLIAIIAIAVKAESRGPVFFRQRRVGRDGVPFEMLKFRSMSCHAEHASAALAKASQEGPVFKLQSDPRVTRVGRLLRRASLDELPQFINVLLGQMSLVGPRPLPLADIETWLARQGADLPEELTEWLTLRHAVRPGLSGLWQVRGRSLLPFEKWIRYDLDYVRAQGWKLDLEILALTPVVVLLGKGAV